jgi:aldehyde dehydrogenase (NAD+)
MKQILERQKDFFNSGKTKNISFRIAMLRKLGQAIKEREIILFRALKQDLNKSEYEAYLSELQMVYSEIDTAIRHLKTWSKPRRVKTPITHFPASSWVYYEPYGTVLILAPWNYPFQLGLVPLVGAIAAGNCVVIKPSRSSPAVSKAIRDMIGEIWNSRYVYCIEPDVPYDTVLNQRYDMIFFTGSERVGKIVMEAASHHLTPVVLELGGKSPCIVDRTADLQLAARRIAWGKFLNAGQTCVAPDYLLIDHSVEERFLECFRQTVKRMYGNALENPDYPKIINQTHFDRLVRYIDATDSKYGGTYDRESQKIAPTLFYHSGWDSDIMKEEIFGPILPVISYRKLEDALKMIQSRPKPLACYLFSEDRRTVKTVLSRCTFGGGCINDVVMHLANHYLPFGGIGNSGMGNYHGKYSFETFSHHKGVLWSGTKMDLPFRYPPYQLERLKTLRKMMNYSWDEKESND